MTCWRTSWRNSPGGRHDAHLRLRPMVACLLDRLPTTGIAFWTQSLGITFTSPMEPLHLLLSRYLEQCAVVPYNQAHTDLCRHERVWRAAHCGIFQLDDVGGRRHVDGAYCTTTLCVVATINCRTCTSRSSKTFYLPIALRCCFGRCTWRLCFRRCRCRCSCLLSTLGAWWTPPLCAGTTSWHSSDLRMVCVSVYLHLPPGCAVRAWRPCCRRGRRGSASTSTSRTTTMMMGWHCNHGLPRVMTTPGWGAHTQHTRSRAPVLTKNVCNLNIA